MSKKKGIDIEEEIANLARKTNINMRKTEFAYESQLKQLDKDIDNIFNEKIRDFDKNKELTSIHLTNEYKTDSIDRYREKLKRI